MAGEVAHQRLGIGDGQWLGIPHSLLPLSHLREQLGNHWSVAWIARHIHALVGIMGQVKQLTMIHRRIANELPPFVAHGSHESLIRQEDRVTDLPSLRGPQGPKIETGHSGRNR